MPDINETQMDTPSSEQEDYWISTARDTKEYVEKHDVMAISETTTDDIPETDNKKVRELDLEALQ